MNSNLPNAQAEQARRGIMKGWSTMRQATSSLLSTDNNTSNVSNEKEQKKESTQTKVSDQKDTSKKSHDRDVDVATRGLIDQLGTLTSDLANMQMEKAELDEEAKRLKEENENMKSSQAASKQMVSDAEKKAKEMEKKLKETLDKVAFEKVQQGQIELRELRETKTNLDIQISLVDKDNETLQQSLHETQEALKQKKHELEEKKEEEKQIMIKIQETQEKKKELAIEAESHKQKTISFATSSKEEKSRLMKEIEEINQKHQKEVDEFKASKKDKLLKLKKERDRYKKKSETLAEELKKTLKEHENNVAPMKKMQKENIELRDHLERKSQGLTDALEALGVYINQPQQQETIIPSSNESKQKQINIRAPSFPTSLINTVTGETSKKEQIIANLKTSIEDKTEVINALRSANQEVSQRVIELEEKLGQRLASLDRAVVQKDDSEGSDDDDGLP